MATLKARQQDAQGNGKQHNKKPGQQRQGRCDLDLSLHDFFYGHEITVADAGVPGKESLQPLEVPGEDVAVQAELLAQRFRRFRRPIRPQELRRGVAWYDLKCQEGEE